MNTMENELKQLKEKLFKKASFRKEIEKQDLVFEIAESIIDARIKKGMTQKELAKKIKTKQSGIARIESGRHWPNFKSLEKIAKILNIKMRNPLMSEEYSTPTYYFYFCEVANDNIKTETSCDVVDKNSQVNIL